MALDFITKLPILIELYIGLEYNSIMVVTDRLTKFTYFIPYIEECIVEDLAYLF